MRYRPSSAAFELPRFKKRGELQTSEEVAERDSLVDFVQGLARAILQNSYYAPDHPQARRTAQEPFDQLQKLGKRWDEFTFVAASWSEEESVAIEGVFNEAVGVETIIGGVAGEHFSKKLHTFTKRNRLVSFSIKNTIHEEEFHRFIGVFVKRHVDMEANQLIEQLDDSLGGPRFTDQLIDQNVVNVTVVLEDDLVEEKRRLPWRVKIALARLKKDLRAIPIYSRATDSELRDAKYRLLRDILRPLRRGAYLKQLFLNLDLIHSEIEELRDVENMVEDMLAALPVPRVIELGKAILLEHERLQRPNLSRESNVREDLPQTISEQLNLIGERLTHHPDTKGVVPLLRSLFDAKAIPLSVLPPDLQARIRMDRWTANFLVDPDGFIQMFEGLDQPQTYMAQLPNVVTIFPNLIRVKRYAEAEQIVDLLDRHQREPGPFEGRDELVRTAMSSVDNSVALDALVDAMVNETGAVRASVRRLFSVMGVASVGPLVRIMETCKKQDVCSDAALTLVSLGPEVVPYIEATLDDRSTRPNTARYLLKALAELGAEESTDIIVEHLRHPKPPVRDAALAALVKLHGSKAQHLAIRAVADSSPEVARRAIRMLSAMKCRHPAYILRLLELLGAVPPEHDTAIADPESQTALQVAAVAGLAVVGNMGMGKLGSVESVLVDQLNSESMVSQLLKRGAISEEDPVRIAICDALAAIGGEVALDRLSRHNLEKSPLVRQRMHRAWSELSRRLQA